MNVLTIYPLEKTDYYNRLKLGHFKLTVGLTLAALFDVQDLVVEAQLGRKMRQPDNTLVSALVSQGLSLGTFVVVLCCGVVLLCAGCGCLLCLWLWLWSCGCYCRHEGVVVVIVLACLIIYSED